MKKKMLKVESLLHFEFVDESSCFHTPNEKLVFVIDHSPPLITYSLLLVSC